MNIIEVIDVPNVPVFQRYSQLEIEKDTSLKLYHMSGPLCTFTNALNSTNQRTGNTTWNFGYCWFRSQSDVAQECCRSWSFNQKFKHVIGFTIINSHIQVNIRSCIPISVLLFLLCLHCPYSDHLEFSFPHYPYYIYAL